MRFGNFFQLVEGFAVNLRFRDPEQIIGSFSVIRIRARQIRLFGPDAVQAAAQIYVFRFRQPFPGAVDRVYAANENAVGNQKNPGIFFIRFIHNDARRIRRAGFAERRRLRSPCFRLRIVYIPAIIVKRDGARVNPYADSGFIC